MAGSASAVQATVTTSVRASKTWVLPPRAKPGRKSKKDLAAAAAPAPSEDAADDDADYDKTSSRTKQKASRERKQEYIAELEAKVRTYEQGDGERASFFQELAKRYSEERDAFKRENEELRARIRVVESSIPQGTVPPALHRASSSSDGTTSRSKRQKTRSDSISSAASSSAGSSTLSAASTARPPLQRSANSAPRPAATAAADAGPSLSPSLSPQLRIIPAQDANASGSVRYRYTDASSLAPSAAAYYVPPSPPVSSDLSPSVRSETALAPAPAHTSASSRHAHRSGCGLCDETSSSQCICQELGIAGGQSGGSGGAGADSAIPAANLAASDNASCGMCDETASESCICKEMGLRSGSDALTSSAPPVTAPIPNTPAGPARQRDTLSMSAVPLRLAKRKRSNSQSSSNSRPVIWRIDNAGAPTPLPVPAQPVQPSGPRTSPAAGVALRRRLIKVGSRLPCSGDPKTCLACADDPAGQAFCSALSSTVCSTTPCANCPNRPSPLANEVKMRSSPAVSDPAGSAIPLLVASSSSSSLLASEPYAVSSAPGETQTETEVRQMRQDLRRRDSSTRDEVPDAMVPCSDAWATLRAHPNIGFANLDLLASVVAKRTHCTASERRDAEGKVIEIGREGVEEGLEFLDHVRD